MEEKKAIVFDTNFIFSRKDLKNDIEKLKDDFIVYVTQVSIEERIAQECRTIKKDYESVESYKVKYKKYAKIEFFITYEEAEKKRRDSMQQSYDRLFGDRIIPLPKDESTFSAIFDRSLRKLPPFLLESNASDRGFKDSVIWLSLLSFFKDNGESEIFFVTDDKGFTNNNADLEKEFAEYTGKTISIRENSFYRDYIEPPKSETQELPTIPDLDSTRETIKTTIESICFSVVENDFGEEYCCNFYTTSEKFDRESTNSVFDNMEKVLNDHIFEKTIAASVVFSANQGIVDGKNEIPINNIEKAMKLYKNFVENYPDYVGQFLEAATKILNENYNPRLFSSDSDVPF